MGLQEKQGLHTVWMADTKAHQTLSGYIRIMKLHRNLLDQRLNKTGVYRSQHQILMLLSGHPDISQREIADWLSVSTATIAVSVKKLEKGGYITRLVNQEDNRFNLLCLTEKGKDTVEHSRRFFLNVEEEMFRGFTDEEFDVMDGMLDRIYENLSRVTSEAMEEKEDI